MRGQLSAEMLVLIVVVLSVVGIASLQLVGAAKETGGNMEEQTERLNLMTKEAIKSPEGGYCISDDDCAQGYRCDSYRCR